MLRLLLDSTTDAVLLFGPDRVVAASNAAAEDLLGPLAAVGTPLDAVAQQLASDRGPVLREEIARALGDLLPWRGVIDVTGAAGQACTLGCTIRRGDESLVIVLHDLTETRLREAAEREVVARETFVAHLGHELRTPLNAALGFAQLLDLEDLSAEQREDVARILTAGRLMQSLLDEVLDLSRVRGGGIDLDVGPVPVLEVARGVADLVAPLADQRAIRRTVVADGAPVALADRRRLWQVLLNLVGNAVKYGREGGSVRITVRADGDATVVIDVQDDGVGIDAASLERVFRPFDRLGQERSAVEGSGLGLAMAQALVHAMSGTIAATSVVGEGSTFSVRLPAVDTDEIEEAPDARPLVVHVCSEPGAQALVAQALRQRLGVDVLTVERGAHALETVRAQRPRLVVLDTDLRDSRGTEVLARLASDPLSALVPRVVLTSEQDPRVHLRLRAAGAHEVLALPLDVRLLLQVVRERLDA